MENEAYIEYCAQQLKLVFKATKQGKPDLKHKHQTEGLLRAGEILNVLNRSEAAELIEKVHLEVFGLTPNQRAEKKNTLQQVKELALDDFFDIPAIHRRT